MAQTVKNLPAVQETWVRPLGWKEPLEKGMHSSILAMDRGAWRATVRGVTKRHDRSDFHILLTSTSILL